MDEIEYNYIYDYIQHHGYPKQSTKLEKRKIRAKSHSFATDGTNLIYGNKIVAKKLDMVKIFQLYHDNPTFGGHLGRDKTYQKIAEKYYCKGLFNMVAEYCQKCEKCAKNNPQIPTILPELHPIPVPCKVWSLTTIDIVGPLPKTVGGNVYIVAITDNFSKWSEVEAILDKSAASVATFLITCICRYGVMDNLTSDQGREFVNEIIDNICTTLDIKHRISSEYYPQTCGQRERDNRTLKQMLRKFINENQNDWDTLLQKVLFAY